MPSPPTTTTIPGGRGSLPTVNLPPKSPSAVIAQADAQWLFTETELASTPSIVDGMTVTAERELRTKGLNFILQVGIMLKIQQLTLYTAGVFFNRFLMRHSLQKTASNPKPLHHYQIAATALMLATKTDETIRRTKDIIIACCRVAQKNPHLVIDEQTKDYWKWRDTLLLNEDVLLEALCFDLTVESPYKLLYEMLRALHVDTNKVLRNSAWAFLCDSLMTTLCLLQSSRTIAAAALWCGARHAETPLQGENDGTSGDDKSSPMALGTAKPSARPWWEIVHVRLRDVKKACNYMAGLYENSTSMSKAEGTPNASGANEGNLGSVSQSQNNKDIYAGLRSEISDDEEDGELIDEEEDGEDQEGKSLVSSFAANNGGPSAQSFKDQTRGTKRARSDGDNGDGDGG